MTWLDDVQRVFADATERHGTVRVDVPTDAWLPSVMRARDELGCRDLDFVTAVDHGDRLEAVVRVCRCESGRRDGLVLRTNAGAGVETLSAAYAGAAWHERELHEMFGVDVHGHPGLEPLLLAGDVTAPLRKDVWLRARQDKTWPGRKEPGESDATASPSRRRTLPPGVPAEPRGGRR